MGWSAGWAQLPRIAPHSAEHIAIEPIAVLACASVIADPIVDNG